MKKIMLTMASVITALIMLAGPATAGGSCFCSPWDYFKQNDCGTSSATGHLAINKGDGDRIWVEGSVNDVGNPDGWDWKLWHNGTVSYSGSETGDFTKQKILVNLVGSPEDITWVAKSTTGVTCKAEIIVYGQ